MKNIIHTKRKYKKLINEIEEFVFYAKQAKEIFEKKFNELDNEEEIKIIEQRIKNQPQLKYEDFTKREKEILCLLAHGLSTKQIQEDLCLSRPTVVTHINNMYAKTGIFNKDDLSPITKRIRLILFYLKQEGVLDFDWHIYV